MFPPSFFIILLIGFVDHLGIGLVYPIFTTLLFDSKEALVAEDVSDLYRGLMLGLLIGLTPLVQFFTSSILGTFSDRKGRRLALAAGLGIGVVGYAFAILGIWFKSLTLLLVYRAFVGFSDSTVAVSQASIADMSTDEVRARRFSIFNACLGLGFAVGPFLGGILAEHVNFLAPFLAAGAMCTLNLMLVILKFPETRKELSNVPFNFSEGIDSLRNIFFWEKFRIFFLGAFLIGFGWTFFNEFIPVLLKERFDFTTSQIGHYFAAGGICYALGTGLLATFLVKRVSPETLLSFALVVSALSMLSYLLIEQAFYVWWTLPPLIISFALALPTVTALISTRAGEDQQGEVLGATHAIFAASMALSPILAGAVIGAYPDLVSWGGAFVMLLSAWTFKMAFNQEKVTNSLTVP